MRKINSTVDRLAYILSPSYSGSTLLTFLLNAHPKVATIGELKGQALGDVDHYDCSCGTRVKQCSFWIALQSRCAAEGVPFSFEDFGTHFRLRDRRLHDRVLRARVRGRPWEQARRLALRMLPGAHRHFQAVLARNRALIRIVTELQQADVFLDGSKDPVRLLYLHQAGWWDIRVIYMIRDGRGAACSYMKHHNLSMTDAALEWKRTHEECDRLVARLPAAITLKVGYEELCAEPDRNVNHALVHLGLPPLDWLHDFRAVEHHIIGNSMRLRSSGEITRDEKWRSTLTADDLEVFESIAGNLNRKYGYV
ncbi:MAG TPA: sulfotransferase [Phycisphaerae bacterium]|nr:sulfotransferase [Phycisphaerae bacterium]HNU44557.1 sulfotransferase [Phycisphaerae bacterium]